jgi:hypothetical protein
MGVGRATAQAYSSSISKRIRIPKTVLEQHADPIYLELIGLPDAVRLPAIRWKILNLEKLKRENQEKHAAQREALEMLF